MRRDFALRTPLLLALALGAPLACSVKPPTQAGETPIGGSDDAPPPSNPQSKAAEDSSYTPESPPPAKDNSIPEDYQMTPRDCTELGTQFAQVIRNDESQKISPKLKEKQREAAQQSIEKAASTRAQQWTDSCQKSLVGSVQDRSNLKCAMSATTVKGFDDCLNGKK